MAKQDKKYKWITIRGKPVRITMARHLRFLDRKKAMDISEKITPEAISVISKGLITPSKKIAAVTVPLSITSTALVRSLIRRKRLKDGGSNIPETRTSDGRTI